MNSEGDEYVIWQSVSKGKEKKRKKENSEDDEYVKWQSVSKGKEKKERTAETMNT